MIDKIDRFIYGPRFLFAHILVSVVGILIGVIVSVITNINVINILNLIDENTVAISAELAGFEFAGMSIFISLSGNKKLEVIKSTGQEGIIYKIIIISIVCFLISVILMLFSINVLENLNLTSNIIATWFACIVDWISLYALLLGYISFISSLRFISWVMK